MVDTNDNNDPFPMMVNPHEDGDEGRGQDGVLEAGLPGGRGMDVIDQHNTDILRKQAEARVDKLTTETRDAIEKTPMGPSLHSNEDRYEPTLIDPDKPGDERQLKQDW